MKVYIVLILLFSASLYANDDLYQMWRSGLRWSDDIFSEHVLEMAMNRSYDVDEMLGLLARKESADSEAGRATLRIVVDQLTEKDDLYLAKLRDKIFRQPHWLQTEAGFEMALDLYRKGDKHWKYKFSFVLHDMWRAGYQWTDRGFYTFAFEMASLGPYNYSMGVMLHVLKQPGAARSKEARLIVKRLLETYGPDHGYQVGVLGQMLIESDAWLEQDETYKFMVEIHRKGERYSTNVFSKMSDRFKDKPCLALISAFL